VVDSVQGFFRVNPSMLRQESRQTLHFLEVATP